ncbi:MAG: methylated-DNA--[protein]-cysteine S-methyltransferase [Fimbriimonadaceae bacterium]|nr:methylated-DNA--[protein]-cysteine S-methyltransferase [Fimbriimonadaceae bacterium]
MCQFHNTISSPIGPLTTVVDDDGAVTAIHFGEYEPAKSQKSPDRTALVDGQLAEYFAGYRKSFDLQLKPKGTEFQMKVWAQLVAIPFGETRSYGQLAAALGNPGASRAVGRANATNPIAIVVPCHRVIGANGTLTGYGGGLSMKEALLDLERGASGRLF